MYVCACLTTTAEVTLSTKNILLRNGSKFAKGAYDGFEGVMTFEGGVGKLIKKKKREKEREKLEDVKLIRRYS